MPLPTGVAGRRSLSFVAIAATTAIVAAAAGCGTTKAPAGDPPGPEKTSITVAAVPGEGAAGLYIAQDQGLFAKAGLHVTIKTVTTSDAVIPDMKAGSVDVASGQYTSYILADAKGLARMRILAAGYSLGTHVQEIMVAPHSKISSVAGLKGATIAVNAPDSETTDLLYSVLAPYGISPSEVHVIPFPFPLMPAMLAQGKVGAIYEIEPYLTEAAEQHGDEELTDIDTGPVGSFPISGYGVLASWAAKYPHTAAAFARAIQQANAIAATNPSALQKALITALHLNPDVTSVMATGSFPTATRPEQLQRVANLMLRYGQLSQPFNVNTITGP
jgi:NitT/TauT family transport system substrate-binding protein